MMSRSLFTLCILRLEHPGSTLHQDSSEVAAVSAVEASADRAHIEDGRNAEFFLTSRHIVGWPDALLRTDHARAQAGPQRAQMRGT